ncbi:MAG: hypothetical protein ACRD8O_08270 [Bryobacteraceae bacterium]
MRPCIKMKMEMSIPPIPPLLEHMGHRPFSFYPAILNIEHNEWIFQKATWSELLVVNAKTGQELWIPRRFLGEVTPIEDPIVIIGLSKELEYKAGRVWPHQRRVIEMPVAVGQVAASVPSARNEPAPVVGIKLEPGTEARIGKLVVGSLMVGVVACITLVMVSREGVPRARVAFSNSDQAFLELTSRDDYFGIVNKLGQPGEERSYTMTGDIYFRSLWYPQRSYYIVLMGGDEKDLRYIGAMDKDWKNIHSVNLPRGGGSTASMLRGLKRF